MLLTFLFLFPEIYPRNFIVLILVIIREISVVHIQFKSLSLIL